MIANISPAGTARGSVVASPSKSNPDYFYFWVRDAALVMGTVLSLYDRTQDDRYLQMLREYADFSRQNQLTPNRSGNPWDTGLGEPKFHMDGSPFDGDWGRPQNDGPALRAMTLMRFGRILLAQGQSDYVKSRLYDSRIPTDSIIKADLEFLSHHWRDSSFDLWEEVRGQHFYTRMVQRRALIEGADFARSLGDGSAAEWYALQAALLEQEIQKHWMPERGYIVATLDRTAGLDSKPSGLDVAIVLGALHANGADRFFSPTDERVLLTAERLRETFQRIYRINEATTDFHGEPMGPAIGRYPEDQYGGLDNASPGNPWFLATNAFAELYYRCAAEWEHAREIKITSRNAAILMRMVRLKKLNLLPGEKLRPSDPRYFDVLNGLRHLGDDYLRRTRQHARGDGSLSEQLNRDSGFMQGAHDLTWSYASFLTAAWER